MARPGEEWHDGHDRRRYAPARGAEMVVRSGDGETQVRPGEALTSSDGGRPVRRRDIDWLRIAAVLLLIPYHTARVFNWEEDYYIKNVPTDDVSQRFIDFVGPWHMSLLFLLAGAASWFAFGHRSGRQYAGERFKRLLIPFVFGVLVIVPPLSWLGYITHHEDYLSYWEYLPQFFTTVDEGLGGYAGGFTPGHLWFILFLFVFSLVALPLFVWLHDRGGRRVVAGLGRAWANPALLILVPVLVLVVPWLILDDDLSGQPPFGFILVFVLGFLLLGDERISAAIARHWVWILCLGVIASLVYIWAEPQTGWGDTIAVFTGKKLLYEIGVWCMILGLLGLAQRFFTAGGPVLGYATEAAYPFYILHQTVLVAVAYFVVRWDWTSGLKFAAIAVATFALSLLIYEVAVRRWGPVRFLFGMKPRKKRSAGTAARPALDHDASRPPGQASPPPAGT
jgi:fucose 4-O-acetylase-like acetyltransferase